MSTSEEARTTTLSDFTTDTTQDTDRESRGASAADWQPQPDRQCLNCDKPVSAQYARVQGDNQNRVHECPQCPPEESNLSRRVNGSAAGLDVAERKMTTADTHL